MRMSFRSLPLEVSAALSRARGLTRRPLALHPIPGSIHSHKRRHYSAEFELVPTPTFRLIHRWNQTLVSGSSCVGIKLDFQAHSWIGKCLPLCRRGLTGRWPMYTQTTGQSKMETRFITEARGCE